MPAIITQTVKVTIDAGPSADGVLSIFTELGDILPTWSQQIADSIRIELELEQVRLGYGSE